MEKKGRIYQVITEEGEKKIIDEMTEREIKKLKAKFTMAFLDAQNARDEMKNDLDATLLNFAEGFNVDAYINASMTLDDMDAEIQKIKDVFKDLFDEELNA